MSKVAPVRAGMCMSSPTREHAFSEHEGARTRIATGKACVWCGVHESAVALPVVQDGTFACPVCGIETVHAHGDGDIFDWLDAQASRFGYRLVQRRWALRHDDDRDSATYRVDHCLKRIGDADFKDFAATPMGRYFIEVFRQVRRIAEQHEIIPVVQDESPKEGKR